MRKEGYFYTDYSQVIPLVKERLEQRKRALFKWEREAKFAVDLEYVERVKYEIVAARKDILELEETLIKFAPVNDNVPQIGEAE